MAVMMPAVVAKGQLGIAVIAPGSINAPKVAGGIYRRSFLSGRGILSLEKARNGR